MKKRCEIWTYPIDPYGNIWQFSIEHEDVQNKIQAMFIHASMALKLLRKTIFRVNLSGDHPGTLRSNGEIFTTVWLTTIHTI